MFERVLAGYKAELGSNHLTTSTAMGDVARCYAGLGMYDKALRFTRKHWKYTSKSWDLIILLFH